ncbi:MAG: branched-chain amino acid transport system II carrier protein [Candidatus Babeliaceae bacterium]|nr:branched-chain amino acid transport system II carrier protein [Candidatus Babeliaceae bacterium]
MLRTVFSIRTLTTSLTIFAMLFGAGNLIFPMAMGVQSCGHILLSFFGFALTGVILPIIGLLAIVAFGGDSDEFFGRLGSIPGGMLVFFCMMTMGPFIVMPRIVGLSYTMLEPTLSQFSLFSHEITGRALFAFIFSLIAFVSTYRLGKVLDVIGRILSPLKILGLTLLLGAGFWFASGIIPCCAPVSLSKLFITSFDTGYLTLDLIGAIFFGSIVVRLLTAYARPDEKIDISRAMTITGISSILAGVLLGVVYCGMIFLGNSFGSDLGTCDAAHTFRIVTSRVLGSHGTLLIGIIVFLAGLTTLVSITVVIADYIRKHLLRRISHASAVGIVLLICAIIANFGIEKILARSEPFILALYPALIVLTICNLLYKLSGKRFDFVKIPVMITALGSAVQLLGKMCNLW